MLFMLISYIMLFVGQNGPLMAQNLNIMGKIWCKAFQQTRPSLLGNALLNKNKSNKNKLPRKRQRQESVSILTPEDSVVDKRESNKQEQQATIRETEKDAMSALENPFKRSVVRFIFTYSIRCGRWFANTFGSCCMEQPREHKVARLTARLGSSLVPKRLPGLDFARATVAGVPCNIYRPKIQQSANKSNQLIKLPTIVFIHGGGWTISSADSYHDFTSKMSCDSGAIIVSVDYSLAPERAWPHGPEDCLAVTRSLLNADVTVPTPFLAGRVDTSRVLVAGDSAGGNLAACVALDLIRANDRRLRSAVLVCPCVQAVNFTLPSYVRMAPEYALDWFVANYAGVKPTDATLQAMRRGEHLLPEGRALRQQYVEIAPSSSDKLQLPSSSSADALSPAVPHRLAELCSSVSAWPLLAEDTHLAQMPPTLLQAARFDPLLDEDVLFAKRLEKAGAKNLQFSIMEKGEHCESIFPHVLKTQESINGYKEIITFIKAQVSSS